MALIVRQNGSLIDNQVVDMDFVNGLEVIELTPGVVQINIPDLGIVTALIADNAVTTSKIADDAITPIKLDRTYWETTTPTTRPILEAFYLILDGSSITNVANGVTSSFVIPSGFTVPNDANYSISVDVAAVCQQSTNNNTCALSFDLATDSGFVNIILSSPAEIFNKRADYTTLELSGLVANRRNETLWLRGKIRSGGGSNSQVQSMTGKIMAFPQS